MLPLGSHAIICYDTGDEAVQVFNSYLKGGLDRNEAVRVMAPSNNAYSDFLQRAGVDGKFLEGDGHLGFLSMAELFADKGERPLKTDNAFQLMKKLAQESRDAGFKGTRVISRAEGHLEYSTPSALLRFEREIGRTFNFPISLICAYDGHKLVELGFDELLLSLFQYHGTIIGKELAIENLDE